MEHMTHAIRNHPFLTMCLYVCCDFTAIYVNRLPKTPNMQLLSSILIAVVLIAAMSIILAILTDTYKPTRKE